MHKIVNTSATIFDILRANPKHRFLRTTARSRARGGRNPPQSPIKMKTPCQWHLRCAHTLWYNTSQAYFTHMARPRKIDGGSRHGKHAPDVFRVSLYLSAEEKAIAILTAERQGRTLSDVLRGGIVSEATRSGIMANGCVVEKFRDRISAYRQVLEVEAQTRRSAIK